MKVRIVLLTALLALSACSGAADEEVTTTEAPASEESSTTDAPAGESDASSDAEADTNGVCALLSTQQIEEAVGRIVTGSLAIEGEGVNGNCVWTFEALTSGIDEGTEPELTLQVFAGSEFFDQMLEGYPDETVDGIGDGGLSRAPGELIFLTGGNTVQIGGFWVFEAGQEAEADAANMALAQLIDARN